MSAGPQPPDDSSTPKFVEEESLASRPVLPAGWLKDLSPEFAKITNRVMVGIERGDSATRLRMQLERAMQEGPRNAAETAHALFLWPYVIDEPNELLEGWETAKRWAEPHLRDPEVANLLTSVAAEFRFKVEDWEDETNDSISEGLEALRDALPSDEEIAGWYRKTVAMDPKGVAARLRAGTWFLDHDRLEDAQRFLDEAAELDPGHPVVALRLAECARLDGQPERGLEALTRCLQTGEEEEILFEAALLSLEMGKWDRVIEFAKRFEAKVPDALWARYLQACAHYEQGNSEAALAEIEVERVRLGEDEDLHLEALLACIALQQGKIEEGTTRAEGVITRCWADAENLSEPAMTEILERLWRRLDGSGHDALAKRLARRMIVAGIGIKTVFERQRAIESERDDLIEFDVLIQQPLTDDWADHPGCLAGQTDWESYEVSWVVLAADADDAESRVLDWQRVDQEMEPILIEVATLRTGVRGRPGILDQGIRTEGSRR